jgi:hypothetical protein
MRIIFGVFCWIIASCSTTHPPSAAKKTLQVVVKNSGEIQARKASFLILKEGTNAGPATTDPKLLTTLGRFAKDAGRDVQTADDILVWASQANEGRYLVVIQSQGVMKKAKKVCAKLHILYFLPSDLQEATVDPSFRQELESCDKSEQAESELIQAALRIAIRHLGREGTFLDE